MATYYHLSAPSGGYGCEAAYFAAFEAGETPMGTDNESAIGRAALNGFAAPGGR